MSIRRWDSVAAAREHARRQPRVAALRRRSPELDAARARKPQPAAAGGDARARPARAFATLDGQWQFRLEPPAGASAARARRPRADGTTVEVPGLWTMQGFDRPHYTNVMMPFDEPPPHVPEENPTGIYRRSFSMPRGWRARRVVLGFGGVRGRALRARERRRRSGSPRTRARRPSSTSPSSSATTGRTSSSPSSSAGRTRASSRTRTSGGTPASRAPSSSYSTGATYVADVFARADSTTPIGRLSPSTAAGVEGDAQASLVDPGAHGRRDGAVRRRPARGARARAAPVVGRGSRALHARRSTRGGARRVVLPRRLPDASRSRAAGCS